MEQPKVSIILPFGKADALLSATLESLLNQTYGNFEILCISSREESLRLAETFQKRDNRIRPVEYSFSSFGTAANRGLELADGDYVLVLAAGDTAAKNLLEKCVLRAEEQTAQVVSFNGYRISREDPQKKEPVDSPNPTLIRDRNAVYSPTDYPDCCLSLLTGGLKFRLIRISLIRERGLRFEEQSTQWQQVFCAQCDFHADRVALMEWHLLSVLPEEEPLVMQDVMAAADAMINISPGNQAVLRHVIEYTTAAFLRSLADFASEDARAFYTWLYERFRSASFSALDRKRIPERTRAFFDAVAHTTYEEMLVLSSRRMLVSLTSFPKRIGTVSRVVENIRHQTRTPDKVFLYLASEQFPRREDQLPEVLLEQAAQGLVEIKWCSDLRSHKKYFYVMQEYPDSLIVTVDDDLIYPDTMLQSLFECYLCYPQSISAMRVHLSVMDESNRQILPYAKWIKEYRQQVFTPSSQLFATSGAGTLFPPGALHKAAFDEEMIRLLCPYADDIWLNIMGLINGRSTVLAVDNFYLKYIEGTQEESLQTINVENNQNEVQYNSIRNWLLEQHDADILYCSMERIPSEIRCRTVSEMCDQYQMLRAECRTLQRKLDQAYKDKSSRGLEIKRLKEELAQLKQSGSHFSSRDKHKVAALASTLKHAVKKLI